MGHILSVNCCSHFFLVIFVFLYSLEEVEFLYYLCVIDLHLIHCAVSIRYALAA